jgi:biotin carboxyl carrier protein
MAAGPRTPDRLELLIERRADSIVLLAPGVGLFTGARALGELLAGGAEAGVLLVLGRATRLLVPAGIEGRVVTAPPALVRHPVGWGDPLYQIQPIAATAVATMASAGSAAIEAGGDAPSRLLFRSPQSGRFYLRPSPSEEPFVAPGAWVEDGQPVGLIEVMKTFAHVRYAAAGGLPARARVSSILVDDGADVGAGEALLELEPSAP